ncbi:SgcJ/EcaC family oxidoreductase [Mesorhizobium intechi]|uniref:YybH family protein n=1 Tax=Mesorhizobium intechi TaxID=537601 RepID=UPI000CA8674B|nr:SgcJ/EcaC family oxidoreductase [Mesorhizobium intechi]TSE13419.1 SgcJ/EcaC family oxidoreductase [Mesorhizobium intechi]
MHDTILDNIQTRWNAAAATWDPKALARIYTKDAVFFGLLPRLYVGRSEIEEYFGSYRLILEKVELTLVDQNTRPMGPDVFAAQGFGNILNYNFDGTVIKNVVRSSFVIVSKSNEWQIALHHFSELVPGQKPSRG